MVIAWCQFGRVWSVAAAVRQFPASGGWRELQNDIAAAIELDLLEEVDEEKRAIALHESFKGEKDFVLILDDALEDIPLKMLGHPLKVEGGRLIVTSCLLETCRKMGCQRKFGVKKLEEEESRSLFIEKLGNEKVVIPQEVEGMAKSVVNNCGVLPLRIITIAKSLKGLELEEDEKIPKDQLINRFILEGLIDTKETREAEFEQGYEILSRLESVCLLESAIDNKGNRCVKLHNLIRDMGMRISNENPMFMVKAGVQLNDAPKEDEWLENLDKHMQWKNGRLRELPFLFSPEDEKFTIPCDKEWWESLEWDNPNTRNELQHFVNYW
ncbi:disease resistance protein RPS5-like [Nicotiana tabacum]|uniref:Disease resistance protein RPS5-like n=1 Tax=Nicotiana tabacum TaxID=4097 RepID=A0AC58S5K2_TOBAC